MTFSWLIAAATILLEVVGVILALRAILIARTPQSAIGWCIGLVMFPIVTIPLFLIFGESRFSGYARAGTGGSPPLDAALRETAGLLEPFRASISNPGLDGACIAERINGLPPVSGNSVRLLIDGDATFDAIFEAIDRASESVWVQFFIIRSDSIGQKLADHLLAAAGRGVRVFVLYDQVGSKDLPDSYCERLRNGGVNIECFITNRQFGRRFQINFRNHRKLVVCDGRVAFVGGLNVGEEYCGLSKRFGPWRDTHMRLEGPAVAALEVSFLEDWNYVTKTLPERRPHAEPVPGGTAALFSIATGPAEEWSVAAGAILSVIHDAQHRLWMASPYFVPSSPLLHAICLAALRGVDVRIILPKNPDHLLPWLSSFTYYPKLRAAGVKVWRYQTGFMHQKVILADEAISIVGSINLDYRSFMLNFELSAAVDDRDFAKSVEAMFLADFERSLREDLSRFEAAPLLFRLKCRAAALVSPEQ